MKYFEIRSYEMTINLWQIDIHNFFSSKRIALLPWIFLQNIWQVSLSRKKEKSSNFNVKIWSQINKFSISEKHQTCWTYTLKIVLCHLKDLIYKYVQYTLLEKCNFMDVPFNEKLTAQTNLIDAIWQKNLAKRNEPE